MHCSYTKFRQGRLIISALQRKKKSIHLAVNNQVISFQTEGKIEKCRENIYNCAHYDDCKDMAAHLKKILFGYELLFCKLELKILLY